MSKKVKCSIIQPGIIENTIFEGEEITAEDVLSVKKINTELANEKPYVVLINAKPFLTVKEDAMEVNASEKHKNLTCANALLIDGLSQRILGNFYLKFKKPAIKTKIFTDRDKALKWLDDELKKSSKAVPVN